MSRPVACALTLAFLLAGVVATRAEAAKSKPDLIVSAVSAPSSASPDATIVVSDTVENQGTAAATAFSVAYYLSTSASDVTKASLLGTQSVSSLAAGASVALANSLTVPASTPNGTFYIVAVADSTKVISESNESNNSASGTIAITDVTPPTISGVTISGITASSATIAWTTNESSSSQVEYGLTTAYGTMSVLDSSKVTSHGVTVNGLAVSALYHFRVRSTDAAGNTALSDDYTFTTAAAATGTTYYVATTGSNSSSCGTISSPCSGISYTYRNRASCGDTILVQPGSYTDYYAAGYGIYLNKDCTASAPITLQSVTRGGAVIDGQQSSTRFRGFYVDGSYNILDGFRITNNYGEGIGMWGGTHNIFRRNEIDHNGGSWNTTNQNHSGMYTDAMSTYNTYDSNFSHDNGTTNAGVGGHGFYMTGSNETYINNISYNNAGFGFQIYAYNNLTNMEVYNNVSSHNGRAGIVLYTDGSTGESFNGVDIKNNIIVYNGWANGDGAVRLENDGSSSNGGGIAFDTNISYGNANSSTDIQIVGPAPGYTSANWIHTDPAFTNGSGTWAQGTDWSVGSSSPAINRGLTLSSDATDFSGVTRPQGSTFDIGAFEFINQ